MEIPIQDILEGIIAMMERAVMPELTNKYARGQARAGMILLRDLAVRLEALESTQTEELACLRAVFEEILRSLGEAEDLQRDEALAEFREKIRETLLRSDVLQKEIRVLNTLLEEVIAILAEAEKRHSGKALEVVRQVRSSIRSHMRMQFEIQKRLCSPIELDQLSKAQ